MRPFPSAPLIAVILSIVLIVTLVTPAKADADVMTTLAIAGGAVVVLIIVAYLIVASTSGSRGMSETPMWLACVGNDCVRIGVPTPSVAPVPLRVEAP